MKRIKALYNYYKKYRMDRCLRKNEKDPDAFIFLSGKKIYRDFDFARRNLRDLQ